MSAPESRPPAPSGVPGSGPRERILRVARARFFPLGFARFTMSDLARELGMSKKTLYVHFSGKEAIIDALLEAKAEAIRSGFENVLAAPGLSFAERAARLLRHGVSEVGEMSFSFLHDLRRFAPASYAHLEELRARIAPGVWERLLRDGIAGGAVRADLDPPGTARLILATLQALLHPENLARLRLEPPRVMERFFDLVFPGILTPAGRTDYEKNPPFPPSPASTRHPD